MAVNERTRQIAKLLAQAREAGDDDGDDDAAAALWLRCIELDDGTDAHAGRPGLPPIRLRPYVFYAGYLMDKRDAAGARGFLDWATRYWRDDAFAHLWLGRCCMQQKAWADAVVALQRSLALEPDASTAVLLAISFEHLGRWGDVQATLRRAIELQPDHDEAHYNLGRVLEHAGDVDAAIAHLRRAIEIDPYYTVAHARIGGLLFRRALARRPEDGQHLDWTDAAHHLTRATELAPLDGWSHGRLALLYAARSLPDAAELHHRVATRLLPDVAMLWSNYGEFLSARGDVDQADEMLRFAVELEPDAPEPHYALGVHLWHAHDDAGARRELEHAHRLGYPKALAWMRAHFDDVDPA